MSPLAYPKADVSSWWLQSNSGPIHMQSWLRVSQRLHTLNQVMVGAAVGSTFGALWFMLWHSLVQEAFASSVLVQIAVILGSTIFCVGFVMYMIRHWLKDEWLNFEAATGDWLIGTRLAADSFCWILDYHTGNDSEGLIISVKIFYKSWLFKIRQQNSVAI